MTGSGSLRSDPRLAGESGVGSVSRICASGLCRWAELARCCQRRKREQPSACAFPASTPDDWGPLNSRWLASMLHACRCEPKPPVYETPSSTQKTAQRTRALSLFSLNLLLICAQQVMTFRTSRWSWRAISWLCFPRPSNSRILSSRSVS